MKKLNFLGLIALFFIMMSCQVQVPMSAEYFQKPSKIGLFVNVNEPQKYREGSQGLLDLAVTSGEKYQPLLDLAKKSQDPKQDLISMYSEILRSKGKEVVIITDIFDPKTAEKFKGDKLEGKKYSNYDFRYLKAKYNIDEVAFVNVNWGVIISYYSMIETGRAGYTYIDNRIVNLNDNTLYFANDNVKNAVIKGKWNTPPNYDNALAKITEALNNAKETEKTLFQ